MVGQYDERSRRSFDHPKIDAADRGIVEKSSQGKDNARAYLQSNKEVAREIEEQVRAKLLPPRQRHNADQAANTA